MLFRRENRVLRFFCRIAGLLVSAILIMPFFACKPDLSHYYVNCFNTTAVICGKNLTEDIKGEIKEFLSDADDKLSVTKNSTVKDFNLSSHGAVLSDLAFEVFSSALYLNSVTQNKFNPLVRPSSLLFRLAENYDADFNFTLPDESDITAAKNLSSIGLVSVDDATKTVNKSAAGVQMDLGGVAKGIIAEKLKNMLVSRGVKGGYVSLGGSSISLMDFSDDAFIVHPERTSENIVRVFSSLCRQKHISTSGNYRKYYLSGGKIYGHIFDPDTGMPTDTGVISATVITESGGLSDALSTAICCKEFSFEKGETSDLILFLKNVAENLGKNIGEKPFSYFVVYKRGAEKYLITNEKQGESFTLQDKSYSVLTF